METKISDMIQTSLHFDNEKLVTVSISSKNNGKLHVGSLFKKSNHIFRYLDFRPTGIKSFPSKRRTNLQNLII